jgi:hypothetical protein
MAIACLRLVTFFLDRPLFSVPFLRSRIAFVTFSFALGPYFAMVNSFRHLSGIFAARARYHSLEIQLQAQKDFESFQLTSSLLCFSWPASRSGKVIDFRHIVANGLIVPKSIDPLPSNRLLHELIVENSRTWF